MQIVELECEFCTNSLEVLKGWCGPISPNYTTHLKRPISCTPQFAIAGWCGAQYPEGHEMLAIADGWDWLLPKPNEA